jgi:TonB family protein
VAAFAAAATPASTIAAPMPAAAAAVASAAYAPSYEEPKSGKSPVLLIAIGLLVVAGLAAGAWYMLRDKGTPATASATTTTASTATSASPVTGTVVPLPGTTDTAATGTLAPAATASIDPSLVDQEVARRIAAERARLAAEAARTQQPVPAPTQTAAPVRPTPAPEVAQLPPPVTQTQETRPEPAPVQTQTTAPEPEPVRPAPQPARAREGDLVPIGTEGLTPPRMTRQASVPYPPMARAARVQGTVITSVLVSETGAVIDVRVLRSVPQAVGLNEAAVQAMRRSTFAPATKDGVRVKSYVTVPVDFKL